MLGGVEAVEIRPQEADFGVDVAALLDPCGSEPIVSQDAVRHAQPRILKGILIQVEWLAGAIEVFEDAIVHGFPDLPVGDEVPLVHHNLFYKPDFPHLGA